MPFFGWIRKSIALLICDLKGSSLRIGNWLAALTFIAAYFSNFEPAAYYDYSFRIAGAFLEGRLGVSTPPPGWLNEFVPAHGEFYSVFPLGNILCAVPFALVAKAGFVSAFPARFLAALIAATVTWFSYAITSLFLHSGFKKILFALAPFFGTCLWANLVYAGSWQLALGFAVAGQLAGLFFILVRPNPLLAGLGFAVAFGNRTEVLLTAPVFYILLCGTPCPHAQRWRRFLLFSVAPLLLGLLTLAYNEARFDSLWDFGYARIPGVLEEPWYRYGIFSIHAVPENLWMMLLQPWAVIPRFPWIVPQGFGGSLFLYSPFLVLLFMPPWPRSQKVLLYWAAVVVLATLLCLHGSPGGWQVSYRYSSVFLPWILLMMLEKSTPGKTRWEISLILLSILLNGYAMWIFCHTSLMHP